MVKLYSDGADLQQILFGCNDERIAGFTTNPTLMRKAGVDDYERFSREALLLTQRVNKPISFEVFADEFDEMERQARLIASWGAWNLVYVKIPVTNTKGQTSRPLIQRLIDDGIKVNVTAVFTEQQIESLAHTGPAILSIFAGRIADVGTNPAPLIAYARQLYSPATEILWASTREIFNVCQADQAGADIITVSPDLLKKMEGFGRSLKDYSLQTVREFYTDAKASGYTL